MPRRACLRMFMAAIRTENFEIFSRPQNFQPEIACDCAKIYVSRRRPALPRGQQVHKTCLASIGMPRRACLRVFFAMIRTENFEIVSRPQNFQPEIACDCAEIHVA